MSLAGYCGGRYAAEECRLTGISNSVGSSTVPTQINLWYGNYQTFGANGVPQQWVNILGNVTSSVGTMLTYSLNGAPRSQSELGASTPPLGHCDAPLFPQPRPQSQSGLEAKPPLGQDR